jgi:hypothetical protein
MTAGLGPVDGFDQDQHASKADNGSIAFGGLFTAHRDPFESFQFPHGLFNSSSGFVQQLRKEIRPALRV